MAILVACGTVAPSSSTHPSASQTDGPPDSLAASPTPESLEEVVEIEGGRGLYMRCEGAGSPTVILEGGDEDTSASYNFAMPSVSAVTRTCTYDRANLGRSDPAPGPRGLVELVDDLEQLIDAAQIPPPYVLVGTSGGGYISAGYAYRHPDQIAGMVFVDVPAPFRNPPPEIIELTRWDNPANIERRDYLQTELDAWEGRTEIGDIPVTIISVQPSEEDISGAEFPSEREGMARNVEDQQGWLVFSPRAEQMIVHTGHAVEEEDPELVTQAILDVVDASR